VLIDVDRVIMPPPVTYGMNLLVVASIAHELNNTPNDVLLKPPIVVTAVDAPRGYVFLVDGRHRLMAHHVAGRRQIEVDFPS
jgi:hypothetical protein